MSELGRVLFFLRGNNDIDNIAPVIYKFGESSDVPVEVVLRYRALADDFRLKFIQEYKNVDINVADYSKMYVSPIDMSVGESSERTEQTIKEQLVENIKEVGRRAPTDIPERLYNRVSSTAEIPDGTAADLLDELNDGPEEVLLVFDYLPGRDTELYTYYEQIIVESQRRGYTTVALPHSGGSYANALLDINRIEDAVEKQKFRQTDLDLAEVHFYTYERMNILDYVTVPNEYFRRGFELSMSDDKIKTTGSARYCEEWVDVLEEITPAEADIPIDSEHRLVLFLGRSMQIDKSDARATAAIISQLPGTVVAVKNHPREQMLGPDDIDSHEDIVIADEYSSPSLLVWGDVFFNAGTSVVIDCIVREKPLFDLDYMHTNETPIVQYLPECEIGTYDELYRTLADLVQRDEYTHFYDDKHRTAYIEDVVTGESNDILERHMEVFDEIAT